MADAIPVTGTDPVETPAPKTRKTRKPAEKPAPKAPVTHGVTPGTTYKQSNGTVVRNF